MAYNEYKFYQLLTFIIYLFQLHYVIVKRVLGHAFKTN